MDFKIATVIRQEFKNKHKENKIYPQFILKTPRTLTIDCWQCVYR